MKYNLLCFQISSNQFYVINVINTITKYQQISLRKIKDISD